MKWTVASAVDIFSERKSWRNPLSICLGSSVPPFYLDKFYCFGLKMKDHRTSILFILVLYKALGTDIIFYVKSMVMTALAVTHIGLHTMNTQMSWAVLYAHYASYVGPNKLCKRPTSISC